MKHILILLRIGGRLAFPGIRPGGGPVAANRAAIPAGLETGVSRPGIGGEARTGPDTKGNRMKPRVLAIVACAGLLAACVDGSGGGSVSSGLSDLGGIGQATGLAPPVDDSGAAFAATGLPSAG